MARSMVKLFGLLFLGLREGASSTSSSSLRSGAGHLRARQEADVVETGIEKSHGKDAEAINSDGEGASGDENDDTGDMPDAGETSSFKSGIEHILIAPRWKLAFCWIDKNAGTDFNRLFNVLNNITGVGGSWDSFKWQSPWSQSSLNMIGKTAGLEKEYLNRENGWRWAVFLRDPLERYLSAFLSKCVNKEEGGEHCAPFRNCAGEGPWRGLCNTATSNASQELQVSAFQAAVAASVLEPHEIFKDSHWRRQVEFCGGLTDGIRDYDYIGFMEGDVNQQVHDLFSENPVVAELSNSSEQDQKVREIIDTLFPLKGNADANWQAAYANKEMSLFYESPEIRRSVESLYADDVELLNLAEQLVS